MADGMPGQQPPSDGVSLIFFDAGGGHRNAATALQVQIERQGLPFEVTLVNLQEVLDPLDILPQAHRNSNSRYVQQDAAQWLDAWAARN